MSAAPVGPTRLHVAPRIFFTEGRPTGIAFTERMAGFWSPAATVGAETFDRRRYEAAYLAGRRAGRRLELVLTVVAENLENMLNDANHEAGFAGTATVTGARDDAGARTALVTRGRFRLFVGDHREIASRKMEYAADVEVPGGPRWRLDGFKAIRHGEGTAGFVVRGRLQPLHWSASGIWYDQTRLFFTLRSLDGVAEHGLGILDLSFADLMRQLLTIRPRGATTLGERSDTVMRFLQFFTGVLRDTYGGPFARSHYAPPNWWRRPRRELAGGLKAEPHGFRTTDGVDLKLTRYRGGSQGPVILAPGFGVRADSFAIDTVKENLVEFLGGKGYDVWLFDYRASPELLSSHEAFSIDHIATIDWPEAVQQVLHASGAKQTHVIAHCVGSMSFMMAALGGHLKGMIGSAICSQVAAHPVGSRLNELKAIARLGVWLEALFRVRKLRVTVHAADTYKRPLLDRLLKFYPTEDPCDNPVCRRVQFVFGESYRHANLNRETHDAIIEMFGDPSRKLPAHASLRALRHLAAIVAAGRIRTEGKDDHYATDDNVGNLDFRLCLLSGLRNAIFPPRGIALSFAWLDQVRRARALPLPELFVLPVADYAHMDCFIGAQAHVDVFPHLADWLAGGLPRVAPLLKRLIDAERVELQSVPR